MSENKRKKKKRRRTNRSSKQKKIDVVNPKGDESPETRSRGGRSSGCYHRVFSRITNAFVRRDRDITHTETNSKVGCETERTMAQTCFPSNGPDGRLSRKDKFEHQILGEIPSRIHVDLFEAIEELCKPRLSPYIQAEIPMLKCLYQEVDHYVTSVLIEIFNNEPNLFENDPIMRELLSHINSGKFCGINLKTNRKKQTQSYSHKKTGVFKESDCRAAQNILHKTRFPKFLCHSPCSLCRILRNTLKRTTTNTSSADSDVSERPKHWIEALISPLGRQNQPKQTKDPVAETKVIEIAGKRVEGGKVIKSPQAERTDVRKNIRNTEIYVSPGRRLEFHTGQRTNRKLQYAMVKRNRMFSRISFEIGRETHTIFVNITATESFWRLMQRLLNSFQLQPAATKRLEYKRSTDAVIRYRPNEWTTNITVSHLEFGSLTITSVPVSVLELLLHMFNRSFRAACDPSAVVDRYQVPEICRYRLTSKRVHLRNESHRIYNDNLRDTLQPKHGFSFWRHFPRVRDTNIVCKSNTAVEENDTSAAKEETSKITNEIYASGTKAISETILDDGSYSLFEHSTKIIEDMHTNLDIPGDQRTKIYDDESKDVHANLAERENNGSESEEASSKDIYISLDTEDKGAAAPRSFADEDAEAEEGAKAKDYQNFNVQVPDNLLHIKIPFIDITELEFEKDIDGNRAILVSGGFGDIFHASLSSTGEEMVVKIVKNMTFEDVLRETRIQKYLMTSVSVPMLVGIIGGPDYAETMIVQQMCAKGRTLFDLIEACLAESIVLYNKHWLELCYQLAINLEKMHDKGILHNDIKTDNILVELNPNGVRIYFIDFGQATFRSGGVLHFDECDDSDDTDDYLAPEVRSGLRSSPKSDIYSLGVIFADIADEFCECIGQLADDMCEEELAKRPTLEEVSEIIEELIMENEYS